MLTDEMVSEFESDATDVEQRELNELFETRRVINRQPHKQHVVCFSLFWKNPNGTDPELPRIDRRTHGKIGTDAVTSHFLRWSDYVEPLLNAAPRLLAWDDDLRLRVYLASDLEFLIDDLVNAGCEVHLMNTSSIRHNPGAMWRFLAFGEKNRMVTICEPTRASQVRSDVVRTREIMRARLGLWRVPVTGDTQSEPAIEYRPIFGGQFGGCFRLPMRRLMSAFIWHSWRGTMPDTCQIPADGARRIAGTLWPDCGFDEYFLMVALYPRAALKGIVTLLPNGARSEYLPLDIEYVTWANPRSEILYFSAGRSGKGISSRPINDPTRGLKTVDQFDVVDTAFLTRKHALPQWASRSDLRREDITGVVWAWFNAATIEWAGKRWLAYRTECSPLWHWTSTSLVQLDEDFKVIPGSNKLQKLRTSFGGWGPEDPRLIPFEKRLLMSYSDGRYMGLAELEENGEVRTSGLFRPHPTRAARVVNKVRREKNWGFFAKGAQLFVVYWVMPHVVFSCDLQRRSVVNEWQSLWVPPVEVGELHGGSTPVWHNGLFWRVVHSFPRLEGALRRYHLWLMAFEDKPPFAPMYFCTKPLIVADNERSRAPESVPHHVVFCGSIERMDHGWHMTFGENDLRIRHGVVEDTLIEPYLVSCQTSSSQDSAVGSGQ